MWIIVMFTLLFYTPLKSNVPTCNELLLKACSTWCDFTCEFVDAANVLSALPCAQFFDVQRYWTFLQTCISGVGCGTNNNVDRPTFYCGLPAFIGLIEWQVQIHTQKKNVIQKQFLFCFTFSPKRTEWMKRTEQRENCFELFCMSLKNHCFELFFLSLFPLQSL